MVFGDAPVEHMENSQELHGCCTPQSTKRARILVGARRDSADREKHLDPTSAAQRVIRPKKTWFQPVKGTELILLLFRRASSSVESHR